MSEMKCPYCGENMPNDLEQFNERAYNDIVMDDGKLKVVYSAICPRCDKEFLWVDVWKMDSVIIENMDTQECTTYKAGCE